MNALIPQLPFIRLAMVCLVALMIGMFGCGNDTKNETQREPIAKATQSSAPSLPDKLTPPDSAHPKSSHLPDVSNEKLLVETNREEMKSEDAEKSTEVIDSVEESANKPVDKTTDPSEPAAESVSMPNPDTELDPVVDNSPPSFDQPPFRILIPTIEGPLLVDLDVRLDNVPLAKAFDDRIKKVMQDADTDESSTLSWDEFFDHMESDPQLFGRNSIGNRRNAKQLQDRNRNSRADYEEVVRMLFRSSGFSVPFRLKGTDYYRHRNGESVTFTALDKDKDRLLSTDEIDDASASLFRVDRNADQRIDVTEILPPIEPNNDPAWNQRRTRRNCNVATDLFGYVDWTMAAYAMDDMDATRPFGLTDRPIKKLDADENDSISKQEAKTITQADPDLILRAELSGDRTKEPKLTILWARTELHPLVLPNRSTNQVAIGDSSLRFVAHLKDNRSSANQIPPEAFAILDANNDGGLDEAEIPDQFEDQYSFEDLDTNEDGKLTLKEINEGMLPQTPIWSIQLRGRAAEFPDSLFAFLDTDNDLSLSTREIITSPQRLRQLGKDSLAADDITNTFMMQLVRGDPMQRNQLFAFETDPLDMQTDNVPTWAKSMDANSDGEISKIEFPGTQDQFAKLDVNGDGFVAFDELP